MNENMICNNCGCVNEDLYEIEHNGETMLLCKDCLEEMGYVQCQDCDEWVPEDEAYRYGGGYICESCYEGGYFTCEECGEVEATSELIVVNDGKRTGAIYVCEACAERNYYQCDDCEDWFSADYIREDDQGHVICEHCYEWHDYITCANCGRITRDWRWHEGHGEYYCQDCFPASCLHEYGYKPSPEFKYRSGEKRDCPNLPSWRTLPHVRVYGVELEVDCGTDANDLCERLEALEQPIYMKHDGSLGEEGVEIVTHPCSLAYHQYELRWAEIIRRCKQLDYTSHDAGTCGLHIHVSREALGETVGERLTRAGNLVILTYAMWSEMVKFSRRNEYQLNEWARKPELNLFGQLTDTELLDEALLEEERGRYRAVNLKPCATVEFRLFRGTLKRDTLIASIQLVDTLCQYAMTHTPNECLKATWTEVVGSTEHKELRSYCSRRELL